MNEPTNEMETILYCERTLRHVFEIVSISPSFPDAIILDKRDSREYRAEFEFRSSSFMEHEHDPFGCDVIICWINDLDDSINFPIWEVSTGFIPNVFDTLNVDRKVFSLMIQNRLLTRENNSLKKQLEVENVSRRDWRKVRPFLDESNLKTLASLPTSSFKEIAVSYGVTEKTISNWKAYAIAELKQVEENNVHIQP